MTGAERTPLQAEVGGVRFRMADTADVHTIVALVESAYRGDASRAGWTTEADLLQGQRTDPEQIAALLTASDGVLLVALCDEQVVACCQLQNRGERAYFGLFAVSPQTQGSGIGKQVIAYAEKYAATEWSSRRMEMTVIRQRADLIAFYERRGYRDTGVRSPFPYGDARFGIPQRNDLEFTLLEKVLPMDA